MSYVTVVALMSARVAACLQMVAPPMYIAAHDTDPPEGQVIGTEATNLLLRLFHNKKESAVSLRVAAWMLATWPG